MPESVHKTALERFKLAVEATTKQLQREKADLEFQDPERHWPDEIKQQRAGQLVNGKRINARPIISIPKIDQPIRLIANQQRAARLAVKVQALSEEASDDTAEVLQGLYRRIEVDSRAELARSWAFDRAMKAGRGVYRVNTTWADDGGHPLDQKITIERIEFQESVYFDPAGDACAPVPTWKWAFQAQWVPYDDYQREYPDSKLAKAEASLEFAGLTETLPEWVRDSGVGRAVLVAEYWRIETTKRAYVELDDGAVAFADEVPEGRIVATDAKGKPRVKREVEERTLRWAKLNGIEVLETEEQNGRYIPLIPVFGEQLQPFNSERIWRGIIGPAKDGQRLFNYAAAALIEKTALEPRSQFVGAAEQFEGYEQDWQRANTENMPYLPYKPHTHGGRLLPPPQRMQADMTGLGPAMMLLQSADSFIAAATSTLDQQMIENLAKKKVAHQTLGALQDQNIAGTSHYLQNLADQSMPYEALVVLDLMPSIYDRPGRVARILDLEDNPKTVMLNQPFVMGPDKRPRPVNGQPIEGKEIKHYDLRKGTYAVSISVGKSYQSRLQEGADEIGAVLQAAPEMMPLIGPVYFRYRQFPGHEEIARLLKKVREKQFPGIDEEDGQGQPNPRQLQAQLEQAGKMIEALSKELQTKTEALNTDWAKQQAQIEMKRLDVEGKARIEDLRLRAQLALETLKAQVARQAQALDAAADLGLQNDEQTHESIENELDRQHEIDLASVEHEHTLSELAATPKPTNGQDE